VDPIFINRPDEVEPGQRVIVVWGRLAVAGLGACGSVQVTYDPPHDAWAPPEGVDWDLLTTDPQAAIAAASTLWAGDRGRWGATEKVGAEGTVVCIDEKKRVWLDGDQEPTFFYEYWFAKSSVVKERLAKARAKEVEELRRDVDAGKRELEQLRRDTASLRQQQEKLRASQRQEAADDDDWRSQMQRRPLTVRPERLPYHPAVDRAAREHARFERILQDHNRDYSGWENEAD
jgi:hypothetical protein